MKMFALLCLAVAVGDVRCAPAGNLAEALAAGRVSLNLRLRDEAVRQSGLRDANALTLRTRLGFTTAPLAGWQAMAEAENVAAFDPDAYSQAGLNPGGAGRAAIADPTGTEVNQAWLGYTHGPTAVTVGRQRLVLDNARFVGDSGWRQKLQTFDAVVLRDKSVDQVTLTYAYANRVNRVFGDRHPQGCWRSDSHLFNASLAGGSAGTLTGYAYLLDFRGAGAANSCATYGLSLSGGRKLPGGWKLAWRAELATQSGYGHSPLNYSARYQLAEAGLAAASGGISLGYEVLGAGHGVGFKTPLATLHAFNGWADLFFTTPAAGLRDTYVKVSANLPGQLSLLAFHHWFAADQAGPDPGREFDVQLGRRFGARMSVLVKYTDFRPATAAYPGVQKFWAQVEFAY